MDRPIRGTAFFPGGFGLWRPNPSDPFPETVHCPIMVIGNNFGTVEYFSTLAEDGGEDTRVATWRGLLRMLGAAALPPEQCFFTNAYIGLMTSTEMLGEFPGSRSPQFVAACAASLKLQMSFVRPRVLVVLGSHAARALAALSTSLAVWVDKGHTKTFKRIDESNVAIVRGGIIDGVSTVKSAVLLTHPSLPNSRFRRYQGQSGSEAEVALLRDAIRL